MIDLTSFVLAMFIAPALGSDNSVRRIDLGEAMLVLPEGYRPQSGRADVILHMHGGSVCGRKGSGQFGLAGTTAPFQPPRALLGLQ